MNLSYAKLIAEKLARFDPVGFDSDAGEYGLFDFQKHLVEWSLRLGRSAIFADCGLGKTPMQLAWADLVANKICGKVLVLTPLAVADQTIREANKFGIKNCGRSRGEERYRITVTNYERLHHFKPEEFCAVVCDESSILKNYAGKTREAITEFMTTIPLRLLCTATPSPNDYTELGTSCEALGVMRRVEMLSVYFSHDSGDTQKWMLKGHAEKPFWEFMSTWSRAVRKPSDLGFDDGRFVLPELITNQVTVESKTIENRLFVVEAKTLEEQRAERRATLDRRCAAVAEIANANNEPFLAWCSLNDESALLTKQINGAVEVSGSDSDDEKERKMLAFTDGTIRCLVTKPSIAGFGMNWQHCNQMSFFPSHSHEQFYQAVRRCWRFGQDRPVTVHIVTSEAESSVLENMRRKEADSNRMFDEIIAHMSEFYSKRNIDYKPSVKMEKPKWLKCA